MTEPQHLKRRDFRALVCITACRRFWALRRYLPHYAEFCDRDPRFELLVTLDGTEPEYVDFCGRWQIPLVYSDEREGVGLSKNRVLERFAEHDYYFFIEDDVELMDGRVFDAHVDMAASSDIHHFSLFARGGARKPQSESLIAGHRVVHASYGGAHFNFFTREGLEKVGGWHPLFAEYKRWGHTEHSLRFSTQGLAPAPFNVAEDLARCFIWHYPPMVTRPLNVPIDEDQIVAPERALIEQRIGHVPVTTISPHHVNRVAFARSSELADLMRSGERYPLVGGRERLACRSDYQLWRSAEADGWVERLFRLVWATLLSPRNPAVRHAIKTWLER